jgi:hypothetical protein
MLQALPEFFFREWALHPQKAANTGVEKIQQG